MKKPRVILADDHKIVLEGLRGLLRDEFELIGEASNGQELVELVLRLSPDVVVADVSMPLLNGIEATRKLREAGSTAKVVMLTMHPDVVYATRALEAGASGYVLKHAASDELVEAVQTALRGGAYLSPQVRNPAVMELLDGTRRHVKGTIELTGRQREVLQLLAEGKSAKEIGGLLGISARTVETHKYRMMDDLGLKTSAELVQYAIRMGVTGGP
ncbi:MAG: response regulator transcription factor [Bryobacterales bacterium]|nr:response regulator transcription factor [Bryobacterales bacterium]